jgi:Peptidase A4 family
MSKHENLAGKDQLSETEVLRHFRTFTKPSRNFDATTATERELVVHGLPPRPDAHTHPRLAAKWQRIAEQRHHYISPELRVNPSIRRQLDRALIARREIAEQELIRYREKSILKYTSERLSDILKILALLPETSTNWSGAYVKRPSAEQLMTVTGEWRVPGVNPPASAWNGTGYNDGTYLCGVWVGIDGTQGTNDVMQAGTGSQCVVSGGKMTSTSFFAWTEWFSLPSVSVSNFPIQVGDVISCTVCAPFGNTHGTAMFNNLTSGATTNIGINPPAGVSLVGNVAEWIVEDPGLIGGGLYPFPNYGSTYFSDCTAGSKNIELDLGTAKEIDLVDASKKVISSASIENHRTLFCRYGSI